MGVRSEGISWEADAEKSQSAGEVREMLGLLNSQWGKEHAGSTSQRTVLHTTPAAFPRRNSRHPVLLMPLSLPGSLSATGAATGTNLHVSGEHASLCGTAPLAACPRVFQQSCCPQPESPQGGPPPGPSSPLRACLASQLQSHHLLHKRCGQSGHLLRLPPVVGTAEVWPQWGQGHRHPLGLAPCPAAVAT